MKRYRMYINGDWAESRAGAWFPVLDPSTEETAAVQATRAAFNSGPWPQTTVQERGRLLFRLPDRIRRESAPLAELESRNSGKPIVEAAIGRALFGVFINQGEVCSAGSRILVEKSIYPKFVEAMTEKAKRIKLGPPLDRETKMGPLVSQEQYSPPRRWPKSGGGRPSGFARGYYVEPTIFADVDNSVRIANDSPYGLAAVVWSRDIFKAFRVVKAIRAGEAPWDGYKQSGFGRELGPWGIEEYLETKQVHINLNEQPIGWYS